MRDVEDEIERITSILEDLEARLNPSQELLNLITYYKDQRLHLCRRSRRYFEPYRDEQDQLVINADGDREGDV